MARLQDIRIFSLINDERLVKLCYFLKENIGTFFLLEDFLIIKQNKTNNNCSKLILSNRLPGSYLTTYSDEHYRLYLILIFISRSSDLLLLTNS